MTSNPRERFGPCVNGEKHNMYIPKRRKCAVCSKCGMKLDLEETELWNKSHSHNQTIRLDTNPNRQNTNQKFAVRLVDRDGDKCYYCQKELDDATRTLDHYFPLAGGGSTGFENLVLSCTDCNRRKRNIPGPAYEQLLLVGACTKCIKHWSEAAPLQACCESKLQSYSN